MEICKIGPDVTYVGGDERDSKGRADKQDHPEDQQETGNPGQAKEPEGQGVNWVTCKYTTIYYLGMYVPSFHVIDHVHKELDPKLVKKYRTKIIPLFKITPEGRTQLWIVQINVNKSYSLSYWRVRLQKRSPSYF
jgi:hypothetical protein